jgi:hypothetical protein
MELETIKILSRNPTIRGHTLDVYYNGSSMADFEIVAVETVTGADNLIELFSEQDIQDVKISLNEVIYSRKLQQIIDDLKSEDWGAGYVAEAQANKEKGWSND